MPRGLEKVTPETLRTLSLRVFDGDFTVPTDVESLVDPVLGLYSLLVAKRRHRHIRPILDLIRTSLDDFFPPAYKAPSEDGAEKKRILFGDLAPLLETYLREQELLANKAAPLEKEKLAPQNKNKNGPKPPKVERIRGDGQCRDDDGVDDHQDDCAFFAPSETGVPASETIEPSVTLLASALLLDSSSGPGGTNALSPTHWTGHDDDDDDAWTRPALFVQGQGDDEEEEAP